MFTSQLSELARTHRTSTANNICKVELNKPADFIYDVDTLLVEYDLSNHSYRIICKSFPSKITSNMMNYQGCELISLITFLESNLSCFCSGKCPSTLPANFSATNPPHKINQHDGKQTSGKLLEKIDSPLKFPLRSSVTPNLRCNLSRTGIIISYFDLISITVLCSRCRHPNILTLLGSEPNTNNCSACSNEFDTLYLPVCDPSFIGFLSLKKCSFLCFNPSPLYLSCEECHSNYLTAPIGLSTNFTAKCFKCFKNFAIFISNIEYLNKKVYNLKLGNELPDKGTCKHYKKSTRWFRFECCKSLYPCDICHDEESGHKHEEALKMVCGFCSKEQSVKATCECGMNLKGRNTAHWEGGKGNRNKQQMSRKDSKKYSR